MTSQETIPCTVCGDDTTMLGTKLCHPCWEISTNFFNLVSRHPDKARDWLRAQAAEVEVESDTEVALRESVKLQSHYAELLNQWDGGECRSFKTVEAWVARLRETETIK